jgi:uncharacterized flavoprotein (TIGR03862 family)
MALGCFLDKNLFDVTIFEQNKALGRKFLVAGKGGFNLTHSLDMTELKVKFRPSNFLDEALDSFTNEDFRTWLHKIGIQTYVGSSGRVFPIKGIKPIDVLNAILGELERNEVTLKTGVRWENDIEADIIVFALGGGSWSVTGSDGKWIKHFEKTNEFQAVNCAFKVSWPVSFIEAVEGKPLKNIVLRYKSMETKGELVVTSFGLEGNAIYAMSFEIQEGLKDGFVTIFMDLKKDLTLEKVLERLQYSKEKTVTNSLKRDLKLDKTSILLLQTFLTKEQYLIPKKLAQKIKAFPVILEKAATLEEAISSIGGIPSAQLDRNFQLIGKPKHYCIGEMVDWHAPTGGFLLQGCFSMGHHLAKHLNSQFGS